MTRTQKKPWLLSLNLQREYLTPNRALFSPSLQKRLPVMKELLLLGRDNGWNIIHCLGPVLGQNTQNTSQFAKPIQGFEPFASEYVLKHRHHSAFSNRYLHGILATAMDEPIYVMGMGYSQTGLATFYEATKAHIKFNVIEEANCAALAPGQSDINGIEKVAFGLVSTLCNLSKLCDVKQMKHRAAVSQLSA